MSNLRPPPQSTQNRNPSFGGPLRQQPSTQSLSTEVSGASDSRRDFQAALLPAHNKLQQDAFTSTPSKSPFSQEPPRDLDEGSEHSDSNSLVLSDEMEVSRNRGKRATDTGRRGEADAGASKRTPLQTMNASRANSGGQQTALRKSSHLSNQEDAENRENMEPDDVNSPPDRSNPVAFPQYQLPSRVRAFERQTKDYQASSRIPSRTQNTSTFSGASKSRQQSTTPTLRDIPAPLGSASSQEPATQSDRIEVSSEEHLETLEDVLYRTGSIDSPHQVHFYTIKHIDMEKGRPVRHLQKLLHDQIFTKLIESNSCVPLSQIAYISLNELMVRDPVSGFEIEASSTAVQTTLVDSDHDLQHAPSSGAFIETGFTKVFDGYRKDGKVNRRWVKFERPSIVAFARSDMSNLSTSDKEKKLKEEVVSALKEHDSSNDADVVTSRSRKFAIWFDHKIIQLSDVAALLHGIPNQMNSPCFDTIIAALLRGVLTDCGETPEGIVLHGRRAFSTVSSLLPSGLVERKGLLGRMVIEAAVEKPTISYQPCSGRFFDPDQTVATFLRSFFGPERALAPDATLLSRMNSVLRGIVVIVGVKNGFRKQTGVIQSLGSDAIRTPESLKGLKANVTLADLRFPNMPCIGIGDSKRPFYLPAELCKFATNQMFHGDVPIADRTDFFEPKATKRKLGPMQRDGPGPFGSDVADDFQLYFVNISDSNALNRSGCLRSETWNMFQHEIGQQFNGVLAKAVESSSKSTCSYKTIDKTLADLSRITKGSKGSKDVLIIATPNHLPSEVASAIRTQCDTLMGVQCCLVNTHELEKRNYPASPIKMVQYTGQIVRKILGRANIRGESEDGGERTSTTNLVDDEIKKHGHGRLYGIQVTNVKDFRQHDAQQYPGSLMTASYLVTITSISSQAPETDVRTTHHIINLDIDDNSGKNELVSKIASFLVDHTNDTMSGFVRAAIYLSGLCMTGDEDQNRLFEAIKDGVPGLIDSKRFKTNARPVRLTLMSRQGPIDIKSPHSTFETLKCSDNGEIAIQKYDLIGSQRRTDLETEYNLHNITLNRIYRRSDGFRESDGSLKDTSAMWHVVNRYFDCGTTSAYLERRHLPDILYLVQAASKRGRSYVYLKQNHKDGRSQKWSYGITPVHERLQNSLYFV